MKTAIITDIHSNIEALTVVLDDIDRQGYDRIICLGDVVGYGADPNACCDVIRERNILTLLGNHDAAVTGAMDESYYYQGARNAIQWTRDKLTEENYRWLYSLPYTYVEEDVGFFHSAPVMPSGFLCCAESRGYGAFPNRRQTEANQLYWSRSPSNGFRNQRETGSFGKTY